MAEILASNAAITHPQQYQKSHIIGNTSADESANAARLNQREVRAPNKSDVEAVTQAGAQFVSSAVGLLAAPNANWLLMRFISSLLSRKRRRGL